FSSQFGTGRTRGTDGSNPASSRGESLRTPLAGVACASASAGSSVIGREVARMESRLGRGSALIPRVALAFLLALQAPCARAASDTSLSLLSAARSAQPSLLAPRKALASRPSYRSESEPAWAEIRMMPAAAEQGLAAG